MKWTGTILIPKIQTTIEGVQEDLNTVLNGYDPQGDRFSSAMIDWDSRTDYDEKDALEMIEQTQKDFWNNLTSMCNSKQDGNNNNNMMELIRYAHRMDLFDNFHNNWLIGWFRGNIEMMSEFIPIYNEKILRSYLDDWRHEDKGVYSVPVYYHS